jgi:hypothetical protein
MNRAIRKKEGQEFKKRRDALGIKRGEFAAIANRSTRCLDFYVNGDRRIPPDIWVLLEDLEQLERSTLMRKVVEARNRKKGMSK